MISLSKTFLIILMIPFNYSANAIAEHHESTVSYSDDIIHLTIDELTKPLPIYSHATIHQGLVYVSGIQGFVPGSFNFPSNDVADEAEQAVRNLETVLLKAGSGLHRILKMNLYFVDMRSDFLAINNVINTYFPENPPARSSLDVEWLPRDAKIVIDCIAAVEH